MAYYAIGMVVVVEAEDAESAFEAANPPSDDNRVSDNGEAYIGVVYSGNACPITPDEAGDPDWQVSMTYGNRSVEPEETQL